MTGLTRLARAYLTTVHTPDPDSLRQLIARHGLISTAQLVADAGPRPVDWELAACRLLDRVRRHDVRFLTPDDDEWPATLPSKAEPLGLWVSGRGQLGQLLRRAVVVLGSIRATPYAVHIAHRLAGDLAAAGWTVVTSGAPGVPSAAVRAALAADRPPIIIPTGGALRPRPVQHSTLLRRASCHGLLVTASAEDPADRDKGLDRRSRLLAAAGAAVVLVEPQPGTLASAAAEHARQLGRHVLAVPGPVTAPGLDTDRDLLRHHAARAARIFGGPTPAGPDEEPAPSQFAHQLIRDGAARLIRDARDVLADLPAGCLP